MLDCISNCPDLIDNGSAQTCPVDPALSCIDSCALNSDAQAADNYEAMIICILEYCSDVCRPDLGPSDCNDCAFMYCSQALYPCLSY